MSQCPQCGRTLGSGLEVCPQCGRPMEKSPAAVPQPARTFHFSAGSPSEERPEKAPAPPQPQAEDPVPEPPLPGEGSFGGWAFAVLRNPKAWMVVLLLFGIAALVFRGSAPAPRISERGSAPAPSSGRPDPLRQELDSLFKSVLADKLEWGRQVMHQRVPERFSEELILDWKPETVTVKFVPGRENELHYQAEISYHYQHDPPEKMEWKPVTLFMEKTEGAWKVVGENWVREWEMVFE